MEAGIKQIIHVEIDLEPGQKEYGPLEHGDYNALKHFFEDIGYKIGAIVFETRPEN